MEIFGLKVAKNRPKSTKILWMIQKIFEKFFFAFLESPYFNSQKKAIKFFSADFPLYDGLGLKKFFEKKNFFEKNFFPQKVSIWFNSQSAASFLPSVNPPNIVQSNCKI